MNSATPGSKNEPTAPPTSSQVMSIVGALRTRQHVIGTAPTRSRASRTYTGPVAMPALFNSRTISVCNWSTP
jgi:hypothetical protein